MYICIYTYLYIYIYVSMYIYITFRPGSLENLKEQTWAGIWPLQDIRSLQRFCERANHHCIAPPTCTAHTVAIVLHDYCARYAPPSTLPLYALHHTILVIAILCQGQAGMCNPALSVTVSLSIDLNLCIYLSLSMYTHTHTH